MLTVTLASLILAEFVVVQAVPRRHVSGVTQAAQLSFNGLLSVVSSHALGFTVEGGLIVGSLTLVVSLMSYSLLTNRKNGLGWWVLVVLGRIAAFFARLGVSVFRELAGGGGPPDWDES